MSLGPDSDQQESEAYAAAIRFELLKMSSQRSRTVREYLWWSEVHARTELGEWAGLEESLDLFWKIVRDLRSVSGHDALAAQALTALAAKCLPSPGEKAEASSGHDAHRTPVAHMSRDDSDHLNAHVLQLLDGMRSLRKRRPQPGHALLVIRMLTETTSGERAMRVLWRSSLHRIDLMILEFDDLPSVLRRALAEQRASVLQRLQTSSEPPSTAK